MAFFIFLLLLFVFLIVYVVVSSYIKFSLYLTTKYKFEDYRLFIPTITTTSIWIILSFVGVYILKILFNEPLIDIFINIIIKADTISDKLPIILMVVLGYFIILCITQAFCFYTININTKKICLNIKFKIKKIIYKMLNKKLYDENNQNADNNAIIMNNEIEPLDFTSAFVASLFSICTFIFTSIILFAIGMVLSVKFI